MLDTRGAFTAAAAEAFTKRAAAYRAFDRRTNAHAIAAWPRNEQCMRAFRRGSREAFASARRGRGLFPLRAAARAVHQPAISAG